MESIEGEQNHKNDKLKKFLWLYTPILVIFLIPLVFFSVKANSSQVNEEIDVPEIIQEEESVLVADNEAGVFYSQEIEMLIPDEEVLDEAEEQGEPVVMKKVYLTFDDGPSIYTSTILDTLKKYDVKATFFVIGHKESFADAAYKRIVAEGHTLAMHSYSHKYSELYQSMDSFVEDTEKLRNLLFEKTGIWCKYYRFPGGSSNTVTNVPIRDLIDYLHENGIQYYDWNIASGDAVKVSLPKEEIISNCVKDLDRFNTCVILLHDTGDRKSTIDALDETIKKILDRGDCVILPITDDTIPIQHKLSDE